MRMQYSPKVVNQYYVVFGESKLSHWFIRMLPYPFQHCLVVRDDGAYWTVIEPLCSHIDTRIELKTDYPDISQLFPDSVILSHRAVLEAEAMTWSLGIGSCVDIVKRTIGIRDFWIWTPHQLYKRLNHG